MQAKKICLSLVLISSFNSPIAALGLPEIAQPVLALKALVDLAKLKEDFKKYYTKTAAVKKVEQAEPANASCNLDANSVVSATVGACDLAIDTAALLAATYLLYHSFNSALQPKI